MNKRITELAIEAGIYTNKSEMLHKFAELIVRECINIVKPTQHHEAYAQDYLGDVEGLELLEGRVKQIKEHFGVDL